MEKFWLTTHWPPEREDQRPHRNVFLQDSFSELTHDLRPGDRVMIYECVTGQPRIDESGRRIRKLKGRGGVVTLARVKAGFNRRDANGSGAHADGKTRRFNWIAETCEEDSSGFIPIGEVNRVLGFKDGCRLRGLGKRGCGLKEISSGQFGELANLFRKSAVSGSAG